MRNISALPSKKHKYKTNKENQTIKKKVKRTKHILKPRDLETDLERRRTTGRDRGANADVGETNDDRKDFVTDENELRSSLWMTTTKLVGGGELVFSNLLGER